VEESGEIDIGGRYRVEKEKEKGALRRHPGRIDTDILMDDGKKKEI